MGHLLRPLQALQACTPSTAVRPSAYQVYTMSAHVIDCAPHSRDQSNSGSTLQSNKLSVAMPSCLDSELPNVHAIHCIYTDVTRPPSDMKSCHMCYAMLPQVSRLSLYLSSKHVGICTGDIPSLRAVSGSVYLRVNSCTPAVSCMDCQESR